MEISVVPSGVWRSMWQWPSINCFVTDTCPWLPSTQCRVVCPQLSGHGDLLQWRNRKLGRKINSIHSTSLTYILFLSSVGQCEEIFLLGRLHSLGAWATISFQVTIKHTNEYHSTPRWMYVTTCRVIIVRVTSIFTTPIHLDHLLYPDQSVSKYLPSWTLSTVNNWVLYFWWSLTDILPTPTRIVTNPGPRGVGHGYSCRHTTRRVRSRGWRCQVREQVSGLSCVHTRMEAGVSSLI
jgi:hypothetical protein